MLIWIIRILFSQKYSSTVMHVQHLYLMILLLWYISPIQALNVTTTLLLLFLSSISVFQPSILKIRTSLLLKTVYFSQHYHRMLWYQLMPPTRAPLFVRQFTWNLYSCNGTTGSYAKVSIGIYKPVEIYCNNGRSKWPGKQDTALRLQFLTVVNINTHYGLLWQDSV